MGIVTRIKQYRQVQVANVLGAMGYYWTPYKRRPHNIEKMVEDLPRHVLEVVEHKLKRYDQLNRHHA